jgi:hypothetical protein
VIYYIYILYIIIYYYILLYIIIYYYILLYIIILYILYIKLKVSLTQSLYLQHKINDKYTLKVANKVQKAVF